MDLIVLGETKKPKVDHLLIYVNSSTLTVVGKVIAVISASSKGFILITICIHLLLLAQYLVSNFESLIQTLQLLEIFDKVAKQELMYLFLSFH